MSESVVFQYSQFFNDDGGLKKVREDFTKLSDDLIVKAKELREKTKIIDISNTQAVAQLTKETQQLTEAKKKQAATLKTIENLEKEEQAQKRKTTKAITAETEALKKRNREARQVAAVQNTINGSIENLRARLSLVTTAWTKLSAEELENTKRGRRLVQSKRNLTEELKRLERATGDNRREVGNYGKALGGVRTTLLRVGQAAGITFGVLGAVRVLRGAISSFSEFERQSSNLQAVLGATSGEMIKLRVVAKQLGATTAFTANQVLELETSFAKLGFPTQDIIEMTASTLAASAAMGSELGETANLTGATLKAFGLEAEEAARVNDVLALSTSRSALDFSKLNTAMSTIAPVARSFGFSVEETVTLLGELANAGFDASTAATSTRKILLNLADANGALAGSLDQPVKDLPSLVAGLKQLRREGVDLAKALELTDVRSVAAFSTFLEGVDTLEDLNDELNGAAGAAERMADVQLDNLAGDVKILNSAWEGLILSVTAGDTITNRFTRGLVQNLTSILNALTPVEDKAGDLTKEWEEQSKNIRSLEKNITPLVNRYDELSEKTSLSTGEQRELRTIINRIAEDVPTAATGFDEYGIAIGISTDKVKEFVAAQKAALRVLNEEAINAQKDAISDLKDEIDFTVNALNNLDEAGDVVKEVEQRLTGLAPTTVRRNVKLTAEEIDELTDRLKNLQSELSGRKLILSDLLGEETPEQAALRQAENNKAKQDEDDKFNEEQQKAIFKLNELRLKQQIDVLNDEIKNEELSLGERLKILGQREKKEIELENLIKDQTIKTRKLTGDQIALIEFQTQEKIRKIRQKGQEELESLVFGEVDLRLQELNDLEDIEITKLEQQRKNFKKEKDFEEFRQLEILKIQRRFAKKRLEVLQALGGDEFKAQIEELKALISSLDAQIKGLQPDSDLWDDFIDGLIEGFTQAANVISQKLSEAVSQSQKALNDQQKAVDSQRKRAENGLENSLAFEQKQAAEREKELIERQKRLDRINKLTAYWNTYNANLASLEPGQDSTDAITKTLTSIAVIEALTASLTRFGEGGVVEDKLPKDGIFRGPSHNSAKGGIPIMVEGKEGILSANEMSNLGKDNFYKLKQAASFGPIDSNFFTGQKQTFIKEVATRGGYDARVVSELQEVKKAIQSKPSQELNVPAVVNGVLEFTETMSAMNMTRRNHYKIKKPRL